MAARDAHDADRERWRSRILTVIRRKAPIALLLLAIMLVGALVISQWRALGAARAQVERALSVIERSRALMTQMVNAETGERGYILTQDRRFLEPYEKADAAIPAIIATLREMATEDPTQIAELQQIERIWAERAARLQAMIALTSDGRSDAARAQILDGRGKALMDDLRSRIDKLVADEQQRLGERLNAAAAGESAARWTIIIAFSVAAASLLAALIVALRDNDKLAALAKLQRDTASSLEEAHAQLVTTASKTKQELQDASRLLAAAVANAPIFVWSQDKDLVYRWISGRPLGFPPERLVGKSDYEILPKSIRDAVIEQSRATIESGQSRAYELSVKRRKTEKWYDIRLEPTRDDVGDVNGLTGVAVDVTDRKRREQTMRLMMREASHRSKNILAIVQAIARQTATATPEPADFAERFGARLEAFGATHALLVDEGWIGAEMGDLIRSQIGHYAEQIGKQIFLSGPPLRLSAEASQNIGLALHELATNAAKYGALSTPSGRVDISWTISMQAKGEGEVALRWVESSGPPVSKPKRKGFGQVIIERTVSRALNGVVELNYDPAGFSWKLTFPLADANSADS